MNESPEKMLAYYKTASSAYRNWGSDIDRPEIYALHCGYNLEDGRQNHYDEVKELTRQLVAFADIGENHWVLDAGCGTGVVAFEIAAQHPTTKVWGINLAGFQLEEAQDLKLSGGYKNLYFSVQDYSRTTFRNRTFDRVIFCESFAHAWHKKHTLEKVYRLLRAPGCLIIADAFITKDHTSISEKVLLRQIEDGFHLAPYIELEKLLNLISYAGFYNAEVIDISDKVQPSVELMASHAKMRLKEDRQAEEIIQQSRIGCVATGKLLEQRLLSYCFIRAQVRPEGEVKQLEPVAI